MKASKAISVLVLIIGALLVIAPFAYKMFDRAPAGATMMKAFEPIMTREKVDTFESYMTGFGQMESAFTGMQKDMDKMMPALNQMMTPEQLQEYSNLINGAKQMPDMLKQMNTMKTDFDSVVNVMDTNVENYQKANQLPMKTMPWFFVIPGIALIVLAGIQLRMK